MKNRKIFRVVSMSAIILLLFNSLLPAGPLNKNIMQNTNDNIWERGVNKDDRSREGKVFTVEYKREGEENQKKQTTSEIMQAEINGLKAGGMPLDKIVSLLAADSHHYSIWEISVGLLRNNYVSGDVKNALISAGYDKREVNRVVPGELKFEQVTPLISNAFGTKAIQTQGISSFVQAPATEVVRKKDGGRPERNTVSTEKSGGSSSFRIAALKEMITAIGAMIEQIKSLPSNGFNSALIKILVGLQELLEQIVQKLGEQGKTTPAPTPAPTPEPAPTSEPTPAPTPTPEPTPTPTPQPAPTPTPEPTPTPTPQPTPTPVPSDTKAVLISNIENKYGVKIVESEGREFTIDELKTLQSDLAALPTNTAQGILIKKESLTFGVLGYFKVDSTSEKTICFSAAITDLEQFHAVAMHELAHAIDYKYYNMNLFGNLYSQSNGDEDFAREYGRTNAQEDFATVVEALSEDSQKNFLRAVSQAKSGDSIYLKKLILAVHALSISHPTYAVLYKVENGTIKSITVSLSRDSNGKITAIGGVNINDLNALESFFKNLSFK